MNRLFHELGVWSFIIFALSATADAQFKVVGPPPFPAAEARQKIRTLLANVSPDNRQQTIDSISGLLNWYRDILDEELIAAWQGEGRANLTAVIGPLANTRVASGVVEFSWRQGRQATFNLTYAAMLGDLMFRYPESAKPFLDDLMGQPPELTRPEAEAVCRILIDMPDIGDWKSDALRILPHYRRVAEGLLTQDQHGADEEKSYRAQVWMSALKIEAPGANEQQSSRGGSTASRSSVPTLATRSSPPAPSAPPAVPAAPSAPAPAPASLTPRPYDGAMSGTLTCSAGSVPQNGEYVFLHVPMVKMRFDYDTKVWDVRLVPFDGQTQKLILKNISSGPQKRCVVHWSVIQ